MKLACFYLFQENFVVIDNYSIGKLQNKPKINPFYILYYLKCVNDGPFYYFSLERQLSTIQAAIFLQSKLGN